MEYTNINFVYFNVKFKAIKDVNHSFLSKMILKSFNIDYVTHDIYLYMHSKQDYDEKFMLIWQL